MLLCRIDGGSCCADSMIISDEADIQTFERRYPRMSGCTIHLQKMASFGMGLDFYLVLEDLFQKELEEILSCCLEIRSTA